MTPRCENCGNTDYEDVGPENDSYSGCCNEPIVFTTRETP